MIDAHLVRVGLCRSKYVIKTKNWHGILATMSALLPTGEAGTIKDVEVQYCNSQSPGCGLGPYLTGRAQRIKARTKLL